MICGHCQSEMTPMITSWFCGACDAKADTQTYTYDAGAVFIHNLVVPIDDADLIDEDPGPDCLEPDFYSFYVEDYMHTNDTVMGRMSRPDRRRDRQGMLCNLTKRVSLGTPADIAAEKAVYPDWSPGV